MNPLAMGIIVCLAVVLFSWSLIRRLLPLLAMQPDIRWDRPLIRLGRLAAYALGQRRFFSRFELVHGLAHVLIFWGFMALSLNTVNLIGRGFVDGWSLPGLGSAAGGLIYAFVKDLFVIAVLLGCLIALARRLLLRPGRMTLSGEANLILVWIGSMMVLDILYSGTLLLTVPDWPEGPTSFLAQAGKNILVGLGLDGQSRATNLLMGIGFWGHVILVLGFLNYLPYGKHFHICTSLPGIFFSDLKPKGALTELDLNNSAGVFGVSHIEDFSWKRAWDMYSCTECGRCQTLCPAYLSQKPLSPKQLVMDERDLLKLETPFLARAGLTRLLGREGSPRETQGGGLKQSLGDPLVRDEVVWSCTTCRQCMEVCPLLIEHVDNLVDLRRGLVMTKGRLPKEAGAVFRAWESMSNPWGLAANTRGNWFENLNVPTVQENPDFDYLYYVGCAGSFDDRNKKVSSALVDLLQRAEVNFACLGNSETCCGETFGRMGNEYMAQMMMAANVEQWQKLGVKKIITACPHCFNTIANEYPHGLFEVYHHSQFISSLLKDGRLAAVLGKFEGWSVAYHDSCYLGRYNDIYQEPRQILREGLGLPLTEPESHGRLGFCCGAGGGRMWLEEKKDQRVNHLRCDQILNVGANLWVTACPYCQIMLADAVLEKKLSEQVRVLDIAQLFSQAIQPNGLTRDPDWMLPKSSLP